MSSQADHTRILAVHRQCWKRDRPGTVKKDFTQKRFGYLKCCIHTRHNVPLMQIKKNRLTRHVSVDGQTMIRTCANGSLKYHKYRDIEAEVAGTMENGRQKNSSQRLWSVDMWESDADWKEWQCVVMMRQRHAKNKKTTGWREKVGADRVSNTLTVTYQRARETQTNKMNWNQKRKKRTEATEQKAKEKAKTWNKEKKVKARAQAAALKQTRQQVRQKVRKTLPSSCYKKMWGRWTQVINLRWDALLISETLRTSNAEIWETQQGHIFMGAGKF